VLRDQLAAVFFRQIDQDRGRFEEGEGFAARPDELTPREVLELVYRLKGLVAE
jgi:hypothetical protein